MSRSAFVYILTNRPKGVLYVGATSDLIRRIAEHKGKHARGFTEKYGVTRLVYFEEYTSILEARARERSVKRRARAWKFELIEKLNPDWLDLSDQLMM